MTDGSDMTDHMGEMQRYARALTHDGPDAEDIVHDAMIRAMEGEATFERGRSRKRWLLSIVHNVFFTQKRREGAEARRDSRFAETQNASVRADQEHHARLTHIAQRFATLPEAQRRVLQIVAIEGRSYQEAARMLKVPIGTIMSRLSRARATLRADADITRTTGSQDDTKIRNVTLRVVGGRDD